METYITICKIVSQWEFAVWLRKLKQGICINLEGWDREGDGRKFQTGGYICRTMADSLVAQMVKHLYTMQETRVRSLGWEDPLEKEMAIHAVLLPGKSHVQRSLVSYSPWGRKESDTTERLHFHFHG